MQNIKKLFKIMIMMALVVLFSCSEDEPEKLSPEEVKKELNDVGTDMAGYLDEMADLEGIEILSMLMEMPDPFVDLKSTGRTSVVPNIKKFLLPLNPEKTKSTFEEVPFDFDTWVGTYDWDATHQMWVPDFGNPADKIILNFPTEGSTTNDATLTIHNYDDVVVTEYDDYYGDYYEDYYPTAILADLYVNSVKIIEIDLTATWVTSGDAAGEPTSLDISVYLTPFTFTGSFDHTASAANIDFAINYNDESIFSVGVDATFQNAMEDPLTIGGYIQLLNIKLVADVDVQGLDALIMAIKEGTSGYTTLEEINDAINDEIDAVVKIDGNKVADIEVLYNPISEEELTIVLVFSDGTTEPAEPYFEGLIGDIEDFFFFLDDVYGDW